MVKVLPAHSRPSSVGRERKIKTRQTAQTRVGDAVGKEQAVFAVDEALHQRCRGLAIDARLAAVGTERVGEGVERAAVTAAKGLRLLHEWRER